ncbi:MAG: DUF294 nucleotidyltransferase-like domain-containing protein [Gammaproteobacteria bacterium]|nr:DUF294 nucleotidyltransferase-like domain-containing protein [Gammaproteobacteria bacterium]
MSRIADLRDIREFLAATSPFDALESDALDRLIADLTLSYSPRNTTLIHHGEENHELYILRSGAVELRDANGERVEVLEAGESFGFPSLLTGGAAQYDVVTVDDSLLLHLDEDAFSRLRAQVRRVEQYFNREHAARISNALERKPRFSAITVTLASVMQSPPVKIDADASIREAAKRMSENSVSSLLVTDGEGRLQGILTDKDLRNRVLAEGREPATPLSDVMTANPHVDTPDAFAFDALLNMIRFNVHHLPVCENDRPVGMVTIGDLMTVHAEHPVYFIGQVMRQGTVEELAALAPRSEELFLQLAEADARFDQIGRLMTMVSDAFTRRLVALAEEQLGPPPCEYTWLALGSQARREQVMKTDQDNGLVYADNAPDGADAYFEKLANFVNDGLDACGYAYCPGEVMARNPEWRQPLKTWKSYFRNWINEPEKKSLMYASIFFDLRHVHGEERFVDELKQLIGDAARNNQIFLATLSGNALTHEPPLGFLGQFVLQSGGEQGKALDLKHRGLVPIIDLARIHALASGEARVNTQGRLRAAADAGMLNRNDARNLLEAFELIGYIRLQHQAQQLREHRDIDNYVAPKSLSTFQRRHLKDAFQVVRTAQAALKNRWGGLR